MTVAPSERWSTFLCVCSLAYIISRIYYIYLSPDNFNPPKYHELKTTSGLVEHQALHGKKIKTMYTGGYPMLVIKHDNIFDYYVCHAIAYGECKLEDQKKYFSTEIYGGNAEIKWSEYMGKKLVYEMKYGSNLVINYMDSVQRYKNEISLKRENIETYKKDLIKGFSFFIIAAFFAFKK